MTANPLMEEIRGDLKELRGGSGREGTPKTFSQRVLSGSSDIMDEVRRMLLEYTSDVCASPYERYWTLLAIHEVVVQQARDESSLLAWMPLMLAVVPWCLLLLHYPDWRHDPNPYEPRNLPDSQDRDGRKLRQRQLVLEQRSAMRSRQDNVSKVLKHWQKFLEPVGQDMSAHFQQVNDLLNAAHVERLAARPRKDAKSAGKRPASALSADMPSAKRAVLSGWGTANSAASSLTRQTVFSKEVGAGNPSGALPAANRAKSNGVGAASRKRIAEIDLPPGAKKQRLTSTSYGKVVDAAALGSSGAATVTPSPDGSSPSHDARQGTAASASKSSGGSAGGGGSSETVDPRDPTRARFQSLTRDGCTLIRILGESLGYVGSSLLVAYHLFHHYQWRIGVAPEEETQLPALSVACLMLSGKSEDYAVKVDRLLLTLSKLPAGLPPQQTGLFPERDIVFDFETRVMQSLDFDMNIGTPLKHLDAVCAKVAGAAPHALAQWVRNKVVQEVPYAYSTICLEQEGPAACWAMVLLAAFKNKAKLPSKWSTEAGLSRKRVYEFAQMMKQAQDDFAKVEGQYSYLTRKDVRDKIKTPRKQSSSGSGHRRHDAQAPRPAAVAPTPSPPAPLRPAEAVATRPPHHEVTRSSSNPAGAFKSASQRSSDALPPLPPPPPSQHQHQHQQQDAFASMPPQQHQQQQSQGVHHSAWAAGGAPGAARMGQAHGYGQHSGVKYQGPQTSHHVDVASGVGYNPGNSWQQAPNNPGPCSRYVEAGEMAQVPGMAFGAQYGNAWPPQQLPPPQQQQHLHPMVMPEVWGAQGAHLQQRQQQPPPPPQQQQHFHQHYMHANHGRSYANM